MGKHKALSIKVAYVAGPFRSKLDAERYHFGDAYDPGHTVVKGFDRFWYVADVREDRRQVSAKDGLA